MIAVRIDPIQEAATRSFVKDVLNILEDKLRARARTNSHLTVEERADMEIRCTYDERSICVS